METAARYTISSYQLTKEQLQNLAKLDIVKSNTALLLIWIELIALVSIFRFVLPTSFQWALYLPVIFLIAGRFGGLLQLVHEGSHRLLHDDAKINFSISQFLCSLPIGVSSRGYAKGHIQHHANTGTELDPPADAEKYRICDFRNPKLYLLLLKDFLGITALQVFLSYKENTEKKIEDEFKDNPQKAKLIEFAQLCGIQLLILTLLFQWNILHYILLWLIPAMSAHMVLMRFRGIAEHGLPNQLGIKIQRSDDGNLYTRSFFTPANHYQNKTLIFLEKILIGSLNVNFHHEHHLLPNVPFYNLPELHKMVGDRVKVRNPDVYAKGYFGAALRSLLGA